ncbi:hypothetical protein APA_2623 [Pseudanabaena sp. lw0831]|uniref:hypothetical protein n=1 Tax=Pseudanabaena sp. lw0831 TaxID=1357935 RepID=UPI0019168557|nr:hypothetical protein [Pseudanabaena sp. lw0831]GBO51752.1 hypothetical protein APA_2623 [Pseudanabaena sp. lw0831]
MLDTETSIQSNVRQSLIQEIEQTSDYLLSEVLDFLLFVRAKHSQVEIKAGNFASVEFYDEPQEKILEDLRQSLQDAKEGRVHDISLLWDGIDV